MTWTTKKPSNYKWIGYDNIDHLWLNEISPWETEAFNLARVVAHLNNGDIKLQFFNISTIRKCTSINVTTPFILHASVKCGIGKRGKGLYRYDRKLSKFITGELLKDINTFKSNHVLKICSDNGLKKEFLFLDKYIWNDPKFTDVNRIWMRIHRRNKSARYKNFNLNISFWKWYVLFNKTEISISDIQDSLLSHVNHKYQCTIILPSDDFLISLSKREKRTALIQSIVRDPSLLLFVSQEDMDDHNFVLELFSSFKTLIDLQDTTDGALSEARHRLIKRKILHYSTVIAYSRFPLLDSFPSHHAKDLEICIASACLNPTNISMWSHDFLDDESLALQYSIPISYLSERLLSKREFIYKYISELPYQFLRRVDLSKVAFEIRDDLDYIDFLIQKRSREQGNESVEDYEWLIENYASEDIYYYCQSQGSFTLNSLRKLRSLRELNSNLCIDLVKPPTTKSGRIKI